MSKYGYIGTEPEQTSTSNKGIFKPNDVIELLQEGKYALQSIDISYLVIAGGGSGAGGGQANQSGGGGGAGGYRNSFASETSGRNSSTETPITIIPDGSTTYTVTVGAGATAAADAARGNMGNDSVFSTITSLKGGGGNVYFQTPAATGGSGGGGSSLTNNSDERLGNDGTANQGFDGGNGFTDKSAGGGGGAGSAGSNGTFSGGSTANGGAGGNGLASSITGSSVTRAGGGGGGGLSNGGAGGSGGGGAGASANNSNGGAGTANTGGGGGGGSETTGFNAVGYAGGSGVVILRYPATASITLAGGATSAAGEQTDGSEKYIQIETSGTVSW
jgi:hypothetical protein